jgi:MoaA/NifB/PqqE/SkfB family radical SAM enzyme
MRVVSNLYKAAKLRVAPESVRPTEVGLLVTENCCLRCQTCTFWRSRHEDLPLEKIFYIIDQCVDFGIRNMCTTGGEPTLRKDLFQIADYITKRGIGLSAITNCWLYKPKMDEHYDVLNISIDGPRAEIHDKIRGVKGSFDRCIKALETSKKISTINFTLQRDNQEYVEEMYRLARKYDVHLTPFFYCEGGRLGQPSDKSLRAGDGMEAAVGTIRRYDPTLYYYTEMCLRKAKGIEYGKGCIVPHMKFMIDASGNVYPCSHFDRPIGNIFEEDLESIWEENRELRAKIRRGEYEWCRGCFSMENMMNFVMNPRTYLPLLLRKALFVAKEI